MERPTAPILTAPPILKWMAAVLILVHAVRALLPHALDSWIVRAFAFDSSVYTETHAHAVDIVAMFAGPVTHMLLHADLLHLGVNTGLMLAFGAPLARRAGAPWFVAFFLLSGMAGVLTWFLLHPYFAGPLVGASGAISGTIGGYVRLGMQKRPARGGPVGIRDRRLAVPIALTWLGLNIVFGVFGAGMLGIDGRIAWEAHLGGFAFGFLAVNMFDGRGLAPARRTARERMDGDWE